MKKIIALASILILSAKLDAFAQGAASPARVGAAAAVKGLVKASIPGAVGRVIGSGKPLYLNDHITTDAVGKLQVMLLDETIFTLGPNADMVLDKFVYDPNKGAGTITANITKGAFRFVTGKIARNKPEDMNVKLKVGTIGVRGTVVVGETDETGSTVINAGASQDNQSGEPGSNIVANNNGETTLLNSPGEGVRLLPGQNPGGPSDMTGELDRISSSLSVAPPKGQASKDSGGDADSDSGQTTGAGAGNAADTADADEAADASDALVTGVQQQGNGAAKWSDLFVLQGKATYVGTGGYTCAGGICGGGGQGTFGFDLDVDFDLKALGGGNSSIQFLTGPETQNSTISVTSYANKTGLAETSLSLGNPNFNGTSVKFVNANGEAASEVIMTLKFANSTTETANGTAVGTR